MDNQQPEQPERSSRLKQALSRFMATGLSLLVLTLILGGMAMLNMNEVVEQLELKTYDLRSQLQWSGKNNRPSPEVVILEFDDVSLNALSDEFGVWPWPRNVHAEMIDFLNHIGSRRLLYDIMFVSSRKGSQAEDLQLAQTFKTTNNVYLSMNLVNDLQINKTLGKDLTPMDIEKLKPLTIEVTSDLDKAPRNSPLHLAKDQDGELFFKNDHMTFDYYRSIMPDLLAKGSHIGIINHGADVDGVSRSNPLFFRFKYYGFKKTEALPLIQKGDLWLDAQNQRVDAKGYLLKKTQYLPIVKLANGTFHDSDPKMRNRTDADGYLMDVYGNPQYERDDYRSTLYFPYLGLRAALDLKYPNEKLKLHLTKEGHLKVKDYDIPLSADGDFLVRWHNTNLDREEKFHAHGILRDYLEKIKARRTYLYNELNKPGISKKAAHEARQELQKLQVWQEQARQNLLKLNQFLKSEYKPQPYRMISAWQVIRLMKKQAKGIPFDAEDKIIIQKLRNKIIFIGATAVATYDIKNTSISSTMPGVMLQANLFDNLLQNRGQYVRRVPPSMNLVLTVILCLVAAGCTFKMRSALAGLLATANIALIYTLGTILVFQTNHLWVNVAMPLVCLIITITITFMLKYFLRNQDYEKTYALATTDSMTGLYNHRFFQDHMRYSIEQSNKFKQKFSLLLIDIDHFKRFNDTYGHQAGDEVLRQVAKKLRKNVRMVDIVARYGGEEMAIVLDRANEEEALIVAHKIVRALAEEAYPIAEGVEKHITISCGVATYPTHGSNPTELIDFSDAGLYRAKHNGRNQVGSQYDSPTPEGDEQQENHDAA